MLIYQISKTFLVYDRRRLQLRRGERSAERTERRRRRQRMAQRRSTTGTGRAGFLVRAGAGSSNMGEAALGLGEDGHGATVRSGDSSSDPRCVTEALGCFARSRKKGPRAEVQLRRPALMPPADPLVCAQAAVQLCRTGARVHAPTRIRTVEDRHNPGFLGIASSSFSLHTVQAWGRKRSRR